MSLRPEKKTVKRPVKKQKVEKPVEQVYTVWESPDGDFSYVEGKTPPVEGSELLWSTSSWVEAGQVVHMHVSRRKARKAHKAAGKPTMTAGHFNYLADMIASLPVNFGDVMHNHVLEFMAQTNENFDAEKFAARAGKGK